MISIHSHTGAMNYEELRTLVFNGDVVIFHGVPEVRLLIEKAQQLIREGFGNLDPITAHTSLEPAEYQKVIEPIMRTYSHGDVFKTLCKKALVGCSVDPSTSGWCRATIRMQPPIGKHTERLTSGLGPHRDVWYAKLFQQLNWWAPIFELEETRTLAFYPYYWKTKIVNGTRGWSLKEFRKAREKVTREQGALEELKAAYANPLPTEDISKQLRIPIVVDPGDIVCFSAGHLHEGIPNESPFARFSTDFRTIDAQDTIKDIGASNVDTESTGNAIGDFSVIETGQPILDYIEESKSS